MHHKHFLPRVLLLAGLALIVVGCTSAPPPQISATPTVDSAHLTAFAQPYPTPTPIPTPIIASAANVGPAPKDCPLGPRPIPKYLDSEIGTGVGGGPVWFIGDGPDVSLRNARYFQHGWGVKILWVVGPHYTHPVMLRGGSLSDGTPLWFQLSGDAAGDPTTSPLLNPLHPGSITGSDHGWAEFPSGLYIPKAGCYYLEAHWLGGSWRMRFAAGL